MTRAQLFQPEALLLVAFFATLPLYSPSLAVFHDLLCNNEELMEPAMYAMLLGTLALGLVAVFCCLRGREELFVKAPCVVAGAACFLGGYALLAVVFNVEALGNAFLAVVGGLLLAAGTMSLCVAWGSYLARYDLRQSLLCSAVIFGLAALLRLLTSSVPTTLGIIFFAAMAVLGVALPCVKAVQGDLDAGTDQPVAADEEVALLISQEHSRGRKPRDAGAGAKAAPAADAGADDAAGAGAATGGRTLSSEQIVQSVKRMAQVAGLPFVGLLVFAFVMGSRKMYVFDVVYVEMISDLIAAVLVLPLALVKIDRPLMPFIYQMALPAFALVLIILGAFPEGSIAKIVAGVGSYVFFSAVAIVALACLCAMAHAREFSPQLIFSATAACFALAAFVGVLCGTLPAFDDQDGGPVLLVISTIYYAFVLFVPLLQAWLHGASEDEAPQPKTSVDEELRERCDHAAKRAGLTPREAEVLGYLGRGHGVAFVAESLVVSESTVRTHVKNIYRKLGVSSREELLQLIDEEPLD